MKWLATIRFNDDPDGALIHLGMEGTREGFTTVDDSGQSINAVLGFCAEDVRDNIEAEYGSYETLQWLDT